MGAALYFPGVAQQRREKAIDEGRWFEWSVVDDSFWNEITITYKPSGMWLLIAKAGWQEAVQVVPLRPSTGNPFWQTPEKTFTEPYRLVDEIEDTCTFRLDDATGSLIE